MKNNNLKLICAFVLTLLISFFALTSYENISSVEASRITYNNVSRTRCVHSWQAATCSTPRRCKKCGTTRGSALGHNNQYSYYAMGDKHLITVYCSRCGRWLNTSAPHSFGGYKTTKNPTCTSYGTKTRYCSKCGYSETIRTTMLDHSWSSWHYNTTQHWKTCNYNCGTESSRGNHYDNNHDGYCDACNYLMAIPGQATISGAVAVKEGEGAGFSITLQRGTEPITYQWYYNTSNSTSNGVPISGATTTSYSIPSTDRSMNGRYYYCGMTNKAGTHYSPTALLTVYYPFTLGSQPQSYNLKKGESATFSVSIGTRGNPNSYTYQWYLASSPTAAGSKINGATGSSYTVTPTKNIHEEYYYCEVSNGQYSVISNRAKLVADVTLPEISMGTYENNRIINNKVTVEIPFTVTDTGEGYTENGSNFTASDVVVKVGGAVPSGLNKTLTYKGSTSTNTHQYLLTLSNINGNGLLSIEVPANSFEDNFHNKNEARTFPTQITIDNIAPEVSFDFVTSGLNGKYANAEDTIIIRLIVTEAVGMDTNLFTADDVIVRVGGTDANSDIVKNLTYIEKNGHQYIYQLSITNVKGDGSLMLTIPSDSFVDFANNPNDSTDLSIKTNGENVIIDNTKPVINGLITSLGDYNSGRNYPSSIDSKHENWAKEDIYVQINATDNHEIDYYEKSINGTNYTKMVSHQEVITESINTFMYYRVVDMAGNISDPISREIKLDKITPDKPVMLLTEQREGGFPYVFDPNVATTKSIYVKPDLSTVVDKGAVQSGIAVPRTETYFTITRYEDIEKTTMIGTPITYAYNEGQLLRNSGYYEIVMVMTDIAGNRVESDLYQVYIEKRAENTIRINNLNDIGSGISEVTIRIYKADESGNQTTEEAIDAIVVKDPYIEIIKNVRLGDGKFFVEVTLVDKVGNSTLLKSTIVNKL